MKTKRKAVPAHVDRLYKAVQNYVEKHGGKLVVIGGIEIQEWPQDNMGVFRVAVKCMGRKPTPPEGKGANAQAGLFHEIRRYLKGKPRASLTGAAAGTTSPRRAAALWSPPMPDRDLQSEVRDPKARAEHKRHAETLIEDEEVGRHWRAWLRLTVAALGEIDRLSGICTALTEAASQATSEEMFGELVTEKVLPLLAESKP